METTLVRPNKKDLLQRKFIFYLHLKLLACSVFYDVVIQQICLWSTTLIVLREVTKTLNMKKSLCQVYVNLSWWSYLRLIFVQFQCTILNFVVKQNSTMVIWDKLPKYIFQNFEIPQVKREQFQNFQKSRG